MTGAAGAAHAISPVLGALIGGSVAAAATAAGCLPIYLVKTIPQRVQDAALGFGAGVMLAASAFSLALPGIEATREAGHGVWAAGLIISATILAGAGFLMLLEMLVPHEHFIKGAEGHSPERLKRVWLFVFAICLHNLPEGLAIGVGFASSTAHGMTLAAGIAVQDLPEGLVVAMALLAVGYKRGLAMLVGMASGLVEPVGAVLGAFILVQFPLLLPLALGFAAGAMLYVVSHEVIPESHRQGHENFATGGLLIGFVLMMLFDTGVI